MADKERVKLIITIVDRGHGKSLARYYAKQEISCSFQCMGRGTASSELLDVLGVGSAERDILFSLAPEKKTARLLYKLDRELQGDGYGKGIVFSVPITGMSNLIAAARNGDENAIESLTMEDIDAYNMVSRRILTEDVFSIVDTFFMPFGMECDHYQIMGEIQSVKKVKNVRTKECLYQMQLLCNNMQMDVCINEGDLLGDPDVGRRFKGDIWMQGYIHFEK